MITREAAVLMKFDTIARYRNDAAHANTAHFDENVLEQSVYRDLLQTVKLFKFIATSNTK
jgi:hypothetical protein